MTIRPDSVEAAAAAVLAALRPGADADWSVRAGDADAFGFHASGMRNAPQFLAMACEELLVHTYDVTCGLGLPYEPPQELCRLVIATGWGQAPKLDQYSEIPLEFGRDPATGEWCAIRWHTVVDAAG